MPIAMQPSARRLLGGNVFAAPSLPPPPAAAAAVSASATSMDAQRAHMARVMGATTTVLFIVSVSYIALSALYACLRRQEPAAGDGSSAHPPAAVAESEETKRVLEAIPVHVVQVLDGDDERGGSDEEEARDDCAVCLAEYAAGDEVRVLPACRHAFHRECVDRWLLTRAPTCPVCRAQVARVDGPDDAKEECAGGDGAESESVANRGGIGSVAVAGSRVLPAMWS